MKYEQLDTDEEGAADFKVQLLKGKRRGGQLTIRISGKKVEVKIEEDEATTCEELKGGRAAN